MAQSMRPSQVQALRRRHCLDCGAFIPNGRRCVKCGSENYSNFPLSEYELEVVREKTRKREEARLQEKRQREKELRQREGLLPKSLVRAQRRLRKFLKNNV